MYWKQLIKTRPTLTADFRMWVWGAAVSEGAVKAAGSSPRTPPHPWDRKPRQGHGGVEYRKPLSPTTRTWAKSNPPHRASSSVSTRGGPPANNLPFCFFLILISWTDWCGEIKARRCLGEWSSPASRSWPRNSPSSTTGASGCWPVFTISKRFAHTDTHPRVQTPGLTHRER